MRLTMEPERVLMPYSASPDPLVGSVFHSTSRPGLSGLCTTQRPQVQRLPLFMVQFDYDTFTDLLLGCTLGMDQVMQKDPHGLSMFLSQNRIDDIHATEDIPTLYKLCNSN